MSVGTIFNIQRFCTDDGPGIRTTVFLKGCPLNCIWCHNPEAHMKQCEILYDATKCISCGRCVRVCNQGCHLSEELHTFVRDKCIGCGDCAAICPTKSLELCGKIISADEVFDTINKDKIFYDVSGGGATLSGGEPLLQSEFASNVLKLCQENKIHTAIETCGFSDEGTLLSVIKYCDLILFDIKETNDKLHEKFTGVSLDTVLKNLNIINEHKIPFIIRAPIIPTLNDREDHFVALKTLCQSMSFCRGVQIMPYHATGSYKYRLLEREYACKDIPEPTREDAENWKNYVFN